jgi:hypothetical protein
VCLEASTAWTGVTAVVVGDGAQADGWLRTGVVDMATASTFAKDEVATFVLIGKKYETGDTLDISFTGIATAGTGKIFIEMLSYNEAHDAE